MRLKERPEGRLLKEKTDYNEKPQKEIDEDDGGTIDGNV